MFSRLLPLSHINTDLLLHIYCTWNLSFACQRAWGQQNEMKFWVAGGPAHLEPHVSHSSALTVNKSTSVLDIYACSPQLTTNCGALLHSGRPIKPHSRWRACTAVRMPYIFFACSHFAHGAQAELDKYEVLKISGEKKDFAHINFSDLICLRYKKQ